MALRLNLHKVPSSADALEEGVAWVGPQHKGLEGKMVRIQETIFVVKLSNQLTAGDVALNFETRKTLNAPLGMAITMHILD